MPKQALLLKLFDAHCYDLSSVYPNAAEIFICPICLNQHTKKDVYEKRLTDGHIWPEYLRSKSKIASTQRVLLCSNCNKRAGSRGDRHMQLMERIRDGEASGNLYGERLLKIIEGPESAPVNLRVNVKRKSEKELTISGQTDKNKKWLRNDPKAQERFEMFAKSGKKFTVVLYPNKQVDENLTRAGWITSGYLLAFRALGYRYILRKEMDTVREYILNSFSETDTGKLKQPLAEEAEVQEYEHQYFSDPVLHLFIPLDSKTFVQLHINFLQYQIRLPFFFVPEVLTRLVYDSMPDLQQRLSELKQNDSFLFAPIKCSKLDKHECFFDYLLGKPLSNNSALEPS